MLIFFKSQNNAFNFPYTKDSFILYKEMARQYKDKDILAFVNRIVPTEIKEEIRIKENNKIQSLKPLLDWFKNDYMKWMDIKKSVKIAICL